MNISGPRSLLIFVRSRRWRSPYVNLWASRQAPTWRGPAIKQSPVFDFQTAELLEGQKPQPEHLPNWKTIRFLEHFSLVNLNLGSHKSNFSAGLLAFNAPTKSYGYNYLKDPSLQISIDHNQKMSKTYLKSENKKKNSLIFPSCHPPGESPSHMIFFFTHKVGNKLISFAASHLRLQRSFRFSEGISVHQSTSSVIPPWRVQEPIKEGWYEISNFKLNTTKKNMCSTRKV